MTSPRTQATLAELKMADWFVSCGQPWGDSVVVLSSWRDAVESCQSEYWLWLTEEAANRLSRSVFQASRERFRSWNAIVEEIKSTTVPLVKTKTAKFISSFDLPQAFEDCVQWDILHLALEAEYADIVKPAFFASQSYWYVGGRFPCGWRGEFPEGKLVIF